MKDAIYEDLTDFFKDLPKNLDKYHLTFTLFENENPSQASFASDNAKYFHGWWIMQCAKLNNPDRKDYLIVLTKREFTNLKNAKTKFPIKKLSSCMFLQGNFVRKLSASEVEESYSKDAKTGRPLSLPDDTIFIDYD